MESLQVILSSQGYSSFWIGILQNRLTVFKLSKKKIDMVVDNKIDLTFN